MTNRALSHTGWVTFAGIVALVAGAYNGLSGLSTVTSDYARIEQAQEVLFGINVDAWGWFWLFVGALQLLTGFLLLARNSWGLLLGVLIAGLSARWPCSRSSSGRCGRSPCSRSICSCSTGCSRTATSSDEISAARCRPVVGRHPIVLEGYGLIGDLQAAAVSSLGKQHSRGRRCTSTDAGAAGLGLVRWRLVVGGARRLR